MIEAGLIGRAPPPGEVGVGPDQHGVWAVVPKYDNELAEPPRRFDADGSGVFGEQQRPLPAKLTVQPGGGAVRAHALPIGDPVPRMSSWTVA